MFEKMLISKIFRILRKEVKVENIIWKMIYPKFFMAITNYLLIFCQCPQRLASENNAFNNELICTLWVRSMNYLMDIQKQVG